MAYTKEFKEVISFSYPCYICGQVLSKAKVCIDHIKRLHGYELPVRAVGHKRPIEPDYDFQNDPTGPYDSQHYACSSCWFHCEQGEFGREGGLRDIARHVEESHQPTNIDESKNDQGQVVGLSLVPVQAPQHHPSQQRGRRRSSASSTGGSARRGGGRRDSGGRNGKMVQYDDEEDSDLEESYGTESPATATVTRHDMRIVLDKLNEITGLFKDLLK
ncbi:hypothetical protein BDF20DRAFT_901784 [Mycotypha africana]|uniref:uncharacterized protein n=1 Tax=Mycotypha africana TaxID=64632 RepID=UPI0023006FF2|nr:uncharacterized protein BDF20DRAFT_901784 [Mycotypha africana]KAI8967314.1 hypothetical protein BDF20DRAFT_901784 [Mycotypha africana]